MEITMSPIESYLLDLKNKLPFALYVQKENGKYDKLKDPSIIANDNIEFLYYQSNHSHYVNDYIEMSLHDYIVNDSIPSEQKASIIFNSAKRLAKEFFQDPSKIQNFNKIENIIDKTIFASIDNKKTFQALVKAGSYDYDLLNHSINSMIFSIGIGISINMAEKDVKDLAVASLFADIGKIKISKKDEKNPEILNNHPLFSIEILENAIKINAQIKNGILSHHEQRDGKGYPNGVKGDKIPQFAQIIAIGDTFDYLTTQKKLTTFDSLKYMRTHMKDKLNPIYLNILIKIMF